MSQSQSRKKTELQVEFGKRLKSKRQELKLTQEELAEKAALLPIHIEAFERGEGTMTFENIIAIAKALKVSPKELMDAVEF